MRMMIEMGLVTGEQPKQRLSHDYPAWTVDDACADVAGGWDDACTPVDLGAPEVGTTEDDTRTVPVPGAAEVGGGDCCEECDSGDDAGTPWLAVTEDIGGGEPADDAGGADDSACVVLDGGTLDACALLEGTFRVPSEGSVVEDGGGGTELTGTGAEFTRAARASRARRSAAEETADGMVVTGS